MKAFRRLPFSQLCLASVLLSPFLCATSSRAQIVTFTDVTAATGAALPATLTESLAWGDYDNDGDPDLYLTNDGANVLLRNDSSDVAVVFTDVTASAGVGHTGWGVGTAFGDLDNDGDLDLYVVNFNSGPDVLYRNDGPTGVAGAWIFTDVAAAAGITDLSSSRGMAFLDYDADGLLDIYVNAIGPDLLYRNLGGLTFQNVAASLGVATLGQGVGVVATDLDGNGWIDLFTGNRSFDPNRLYLNHGGVFTDVTTSAGIDAIGLGMGVLAFDYDNDLDMDLYWTVWPNGGTPVPNALYRNEGFGVATRSMRGNPSFADVATSTGTTDPSGWGISCNAGDVDNDGWDDFFVTNGFDPSSSANVLFRSNHTDGTFIDATAALEGGATFDGRGVAFADFDGDGDVDLCVTGGPNDPNRLWRNDTVSSNRWLIVELTGTVSNRAAIGARIEITTDLGTIAREVSGGAGRGSANDPPVEFGLGASSRIIALRVRWPSRLRTTLAGTELDRKLLLSEAMIFAGSFEGGDIGGWATLSP